MKKSLIYFLLVLPVVSPDLLTPKENTLGRRVELMIQNGENKIDIDQVLFEENISDLEELGLENEDEYSDLD